MRKVVIIALILIFSTRIFSQKVTVKITRTKGIADCEWSILDSGFFQIIDGKEYSGGGTAVFSLDANKRYFFFVSVKGLPREDTLFYSLSVENEPVLRVEVNESSGDHFYPFFTGIREDREAKITGGTDADISDFPWQVFLEARDFTCGGSLIGSNWVITAAHCATDDNGVPISPNEMDVIVGANNPRDPSQGKKYNVTRVIVHEDFNSGTLDNDIALLRLEYPVDYINASPVRLVSARNAAEGATDPGVMSWVTGYGMIKVNPATYPTILQKVQLPIISRSQALVVWKDIPETDLMAGYRNGNKDACIGDSGGPLVVPVQDEYKLAGLVSWGSKTCNTYGAYTRISDFETWINLKTGIDISLLAPLPSGDTIICPGTGTSNYYASPVSGATGYQWQIYPANAGIIRGSSNTATVNWDPGFKGSADISLRVFTATTHSDLSKLKVSVANNTRILKQSHDTIMCAKKSITLKTESEGYRLTYSWYKNQTLVQSGSSPGLSFSSLTENDSGIYICRVTGYCGTAISDGIDLKVLPVTEITSISPDIEAGNGDDIQLEVKAKGDNLSYQWIKNDLPLSGGSDPVLGIHGAKAEDIGLYQVVVTGTCGIRSSVNVYLYVRKPTGMDDPGIYVWPTLVRNEVNVAVNNVYSYNIALNGYDGRLILDKKACRYKTVLDFTNVQPGIYFITIYNRNFRKSVKIIRDQ